jgi:hypothetical protein
MSQVVRVGGSILYGTEAGATPAGERADRIITDGGCDGSQPFIQIVYFQYGVHSKIDSESSLEREDHLTIFCIHSFNLMSSFLKIV